MEKKFYTRIDNRLPAKEQDELWDMAEDIFDTYTSPTGGGYEADNTDKWGFFNAMKQHFILKNKTNE